MGMPSEEEVVKRLASKDAYKEMFAKAFPGEENPVTYDNMKKAIGAFERKLVTPSKFDDYLAGNEDALSKEEKAGLKVFMDKGCASCHSGPVLYWEEIHSKNSAFSVIIGIIPKAKKLITAVTM